MVMALVGKNFMLVRYIPPAPLLLEWSTHQCNDTGILPAALPCPVSTVSTRSTSFSLPNICTTLWRQEKKDGTVHVYPHLQKCATVKKQWKVTHRCTDHGFIIAVYVRGNIIAMMNHIVPAPFQLMLSLLNTWHSQHIWQQLYMWHPLPPLHYYHLPFSSGSVRQ